MELKELKMIRIKYIVAGLITFVLSHHVYAAWIGPVDIFTIGFGSGVDQVAVEYGDIEDLYATLSDISSQGHIAISDELNGRVKIYDSQGTFIRNLVPPVPNPADQTLKPKFIGQNVVIPIKNYYFYSNAGDLLANPLSASGRSVFTEEANALLYEAIEPKQWLVYAPDGTLLNTFTEKPLELGHISQRDVSFQGNDIYRITVAFPNKEWKIISPSGPCGEYNYKQDNAGNLYCVGDQSIVRYSACGKEVSSFTIPEDIESVRVRGPGLEDDVTSLEGYDSIEMADNGDVYTSKVTPTNFSVIKWTWQASPEDKVGGPDAPTDFFANVLALEVKLAWRPSLQDPGCVTGYEVSRATVAGGPYTTLTTTGAGIKSFIDTTVVSGTTYYYKVRALSAVANSDYTTEASAVVP